MKRLLFILMATLLLAACGVDKEEKKEEVEKEVSQIDVLVSVDPITDEEGKVSFEGKTNLPDHASLMFTVIGTEGFKAQSHEIVMDGEFKTEKFSEKGEALPAGEYNLSVTLSIPSTQDKEFVKIAGEEYENLTGSLVKESSVGGKVLEYETSFDIEEKEESFDEPVEENDIDLEEVKEIIQYSGMGERDRLVNAEFTEGEIKAVIEISSDDIFSPEDLAVTRYSQLSDELLSLDGWETLTVEYEGVGTISMNVDEKESNEYGAYFPTAEIEKNLK